LRLGEGKERSSLLKRVAPAVYSEDLQARLQGWGLTILRVVTGIVFLISGGQKLTSFGTDTSLRTLAEELGQLPGLLPLLAATTGTLVAFLCGAALVLGLFTRLVSIPLVVVMVMDVLLFHPPSSFFVEDNGFEYALLRLAACVTLVVAGPGRAALSSVLRRG
jgi:putative oxidoreductase